MSILRGQWGGLRSSACVGTEARLPLRPSPLRLWVDDYPWRNAGACPRGLPTTAAEFDVIQDHSALLSGKLYVRRRRQPTPSFATCPTAPAAASTYWYSVARPNFCGRWPPARTTAVAQVSGGVSPSLAKVTEKTASLLAQHASVLSLLSEHLACRLFCRDDLVIVSHTKIGFGGHLRRCQNRATQRLQYCSKISDTALS